MLALLIGFVIPALCFAIFGIIACLRKNNSHCNLTATTKINKSSYSLINSTDSQAELYEPVKYCRFLPSSGLRNAKSYVLLPSSNIINRTIDADALLPLFCQQQQFCRGRAVDAIYSYNNSISPRPSLPPSYSETINLKHYSDAMDKLMCNGTNGWIP
uniref:Uncharacterized protein n=1 Tax=Ditylenchus dipsaci TaxID=166011 RepID=A0A915DU50_9BILA